MEFDRLATVILMLIGLGVWVVAAQHEGFEHFSSWWQSQKNSRVCKQYHEAVRTMRARDGQDIEQGHDKYERLARNCKAETIQVLKTADYLKVWGISRAMGTIQNQNPYKADYAKVFIKRYPDWKKSHFESVLRIAARRFGFN